MALYLGSQRVLPIRKTSDFNTLRMGEWQVPTVSSKISNELFNISDYFPVGEVIVRKNITFTIKENNVVHIKTNGPATSTDILQFFGPWPNTNIEIPLNLKSKYILKMQGTPNENVTFVARAMNSSTKILTTTVKAGSSERIANRIGMTCLMARVFTGAVVDDDYTLTITNEQK